jgi:hypothetical protein
LRRGPSGPREHFRGDACGKVGIEYLCPRSDLCGPPRRWNPRSLLGSARHRRTVRARLRDPGMQSWADLPVRRMPTPTNTRSLRLPFLSGWNCVLRPPVEYLHAGQTNRRGLQRWNASMSSELGVRRHQHLRALFAALGQAEAHMVARTTAQPEDLLRSHHALVKSDNVFQRTVRLRQALWREKQGYPIGLHRSGDIRPRLPKTSMIPMHQKRVLSRPHGKRLELRGEASGTIKGWTTP